MRKRKKKRKKIADHPMMELKSILEVNVINKCSVEELVIVGSVSHEVQANCLWMINGIYFCLGGFCSIFNLLKTEKREDSTLISSVLNRIGNKWIEIVEAFIPKLADKFRLLALATVFKNLKAQQSEKTTQKWGLALTGEFFSWFGWLVVSRS